MLNIKQLPASADNYIYLVHDPLSGETAAIDPTFAGPVLDELQRNNWHLTYIFNTHHHSDHVGGNLELKQKTGCKIVGAYSDMARIPGIDCGVSDPGEMMLGSHIIWVYSTPGHTHGHVVYHFQDARLLFCGDTLFAMGCGRLFEGTAEELWGSLQKLKALPPDTRVYCAHEYTQNNARFALSVEPGNIALQQRMVNVTQLRAQNLPTVPSTIAEELQTNPFLREDSKEIQRTIHKQGCPPVEVFAELRRLKDKF